MVKCLRAALGTPVWRKGYGRSHLVLCSYIDYKHLGLAANRLLHATHIFAVVPTVLVHRCEMIRSEITMPGHPEFAVVLLWVHAHGRNVLTPMSNNC